MAKFSEISLCIIKIDIFNKIVINLYLFWTNLVLKEGSLAD